MPGYTDNYSIAYPLVGDPIYQGAAQMEALAKGVDTALYGANIPPTTQDDPPCGGAARTASQTVFNNNDTFIAFDHVDYDSEEAAGRPDMVTGTGITIRKPGVYAVDLNVVMTASGGDRNCRILLNGSTTSATLLTTLVPGSHDSIHVAGYFKLAAGDTLRGVVWQNSGGNTALVSSTANCYTRMTANFMRP